jgi:dihydrolipoamide dehydrogenase
VNGLTAGIEHLFKKNKVDYIKGFGKFLTKDKVLVDKTDGKT